MRHAIVAVISVAVADCLISSVWTEASQTRSAAIVTQRQWKITDDGRFVDAEGGVFRLRFAYGGKGSDGWFQGGGGQDLSIVELYYKPTSATRNLIFRNGAWGGKMDALDYWEAEPTARNGTEHNTPDFATTTDAQLLSHHVHESAGRLIAKAEFQFKAWRIKRTHIIYPWGDITVHAQVKLVDESRWNYLGHRLHFGVSRYRLESPRKLDWGAHYQDDGEYYYAWSDVYGPEGKFQGQQPYLYKEQIRPHVDTNTAISLHKRQDPFSGFMIDDRNGNDPDIVVMNGDKATWLSPFDRISRKIGGVNYVETGMYTPPWHKQALTHADCCWFYATVKPPAYDRPMLWTTDLGTWNESFHLFFRQGLEPEHYLPLWRARSRDVEQQKPDQLIGAKAELSETDRLYHLVAQPGAKTIGFRWQRASEASVAIDYHTAFVIENIDKVVSVKIEGTEAPAAEIYADTAQRTALLVLAGPQRAKPKPMVVTVGVE